MSHYTYAENPQQAETENSWMVKAWKTATEPKNNRFFERNLKRESLEVLQELKQDFFKFRNLMEAEVTTLSKRRAKAAWDIRALISQKMLPPEFHDSSSEDEAFTWNAELETKGSQQVKPVLQSLSPARPQQSQIETSVQSEEEELTSLQILGSVSPRMKYLLDKIEKEKPNMDIADDELKDLLSEVRAVGSKWANSERIGQAKLYEAMDSVLTALRGYTEHSQPFLNKVSKREAPDYATVISTPMDLGTIGKKMKNFQYNSKAEFAEDLYLIYTNCLKYNTNPENIYRTHAFAMQKKTDLLLRSVPDIVIRDRSEFESHRGDDRNGIERSSCENINHQSNTDTGKSVRRFSGRRNDLMIDDDDDDVSSEKIEITEQDAEGTTDDEAEDYDDYDNDDDLIPRLRLPKVPDIWDPIGDDELRKKMFQDDYTASIEQPTLDKYTSATIPQRGTAALIDYNIELLKKSRTVHTELGLLKQQGNQLGSINNQFEPPPSEPKKAIPPTADPKDLPPLVINNELANASMSRVVAKLLAHAGFEGAQSSALDVLTDVAGDYLLNLGKSIRAYLDDYDKGMSAEEILQHSLFENGVPGVSTLETYVKDEVERYGSKKLSDIYNRLERTYKEQLEAPGDGEARNNLKSLSDEEVFMTGDFGEDLGEDFDFFGFKELGLGNLKVPAHLLARKKRGETQEKSGESKSPSFPVPPPWAPLKDANSQIGLLRPFFSKRIEESNAPLLEDEQLPLRQRNQRPKVPVTGVIPRQPKKKPTKTAALIDANLEKKRKREEEQEQKAEQRRLKAIEREEKLKEKREKALQREQQKKQREEARLEKRKQQEQAKKSKPKKSSTTKTAQMASAAPEPVEVDTETLPLAQRRLKKRTKIDDNAGEGLNKVAEEAKE